jgi:phosphate transport system protein
MDNQLRTHTVSSFDKELKSISTYIEAMGDLVTGSISTFISNLSDQARETATKAREIDQKVNELENQVQVLSTNLIALRNPLAVDLRYLIGAIKISTIIERQGDMVESCVRKILRIKPECINSYKEQLTEMANNDIEMMKLSIAGFKNQDVKEANKVWRMEDKADDLADNIFKKIKEDIKKKPDNVDDYVSLMLIVRSMERFADYCTNITKAVNYIVSGERVTEADF